jgi:SAM-dependent methyltransferase
MTLQLIRKKASYLLREFKYRGHAVHCPICSHKYAEFLPAGKVRRTNVLCQNCKSVERIRLIYLYLTRETTLLDGTSRDISILHMAPEVSLYHLFSNKKNIRYTPCDFDPESLKNRLGLITEQGDITQLPYLKDFFDLILCNHVLEHIPDDIKAMSELFRVMKPGGLGIFLVPIDMTMEKTFEDPSITDPQERVEKFGQEDHVRLYGADYPERLRSVGFQVEVLPYAQQFSEADQFKYGIKPHELLFVCHKPA